MISWLRGSAVLSLSFRKTRSKLMLKQPERSTPSSYLRFSKTVITDAAVIRDRKRRQSFFRQFNSTAIILITESSICLEYERSKRNKRLSCPIFSDKQPIERWMQFLIARSSSESLDFTHTLLKDLSESKLCVELTPKALILKVW